MEMQAVILAGGLGTRLGDLTRNQPKSLVKIQGKPFIEYQIEILKKGGVQNIVLCLGHMGEKIEKHLGDGKKYGINIKYSYEEELLGTAGAVKKAEHLLNNIFFTIYGDSYLFIDFGFITSYFNSQNKLALMTVYKNHDSYDKSNVVVSGNMVKRYSKKEKTDDMVYIDYGINLFKKEAFEMVPEGRFYPLESLFESLINMKEMLAFEAKERFYEIGSQAGLNDFKKYVSELI